MKNWLKSLTIVSAIALVILPCVLFSACGSNHTPEAGDTYVFSKVEYKGLTDEEKALAQEGEAMMKDMKIIFKADNQVEYMGMTIGYEIKDGKVSINDGAVEYTIKGNTLVQVEENDGKKITITYKLS